MSIYKPTWLYIKQHNQTGLKYFGKTIRDPIKYSGSGTVWKRHLRKHGKDITTIWCQLFVDKDALVEYAKQFSAEHNIVESKEWANLIPENGIDGGSGVMSLETRLKISKSRKGIPMSLAAREKSTKTKTGVARSPEARKSLAAAAIRRKGIPLSEEHKKKLSDAKKGKKLSEETCRKISTALIGRGKVHGPMTDEHKKKLSSAAKGRPWSSERRAAQEKKKA